LFAIGAPPHGHADVLAQVHLLATQTQKPAFAPLESM
jgi:hypothetical protein